MTAAVRTLAAACACAVLVCALPVRAQTPARALEIIESAAVRYRSATTVCADFTQTLEVTLMRLENTGTGRLCQRQPDLFAMLFTEPKGDAIVADGAAIWVFYPSMDAKQVFKFSMTSGPGGVDIHREFLQDPAAKYEVSYEVEEDIAGHATHRLLLKPRGRVSYRSASVWIDRGVPVLRQVRIEEENGTIRTVTLQNVSLDPDGVAPDFFTFTPPKGATVIAR